MNETIVRIAAKGDGVTASGRHVTGAVTGDNVDANGTVTPGPHHVAPPCRHFGTCGGCQLQHADESALAEFVTQRVVNAAEGQGVPINTVLPTHLSPPHSRRRATLHGLRRRGGAVLGFKEQRSNRIVDVQECPVLVPDLLALVAPLRKLVARFAGAHPVDIALTVADQGVDCAVRGIETGGLQQAEAFLQLAQTHRLARLSLDEGYGPLSVWEPNPVTKTLGGVPVGLPAGAFLQATADGEECLVADVEASLDGAATVADLFAGLGTFAFALSANAKVLAVEGSRDAYSACQSAANRHGRPVAALHRDLFRNPLRADELDRFDAVVLDPPRAGAREQVAQIGASNITRVAYISCNPSSWARDAKSLLEAGFRLETVRPVGQFRWSTHVELTSLFVR